MRRTKTLFVAVVTLVLVFTTCMPVFAGSEDFLITYSAAQQGVKMANEQYAKPKSTTVDERKEAKASSDAKSATVMYVTAKSGLNIRTAPGVENEKVGALPYGESVRVLETAPASDGSEWALLMYDGNVTACSAAWLSEDEPAPQEEPDNNEVSSDGWRYYGACTVTHYCNCSVCCGQWAGGGTASGTTPTAGRTVAADLPFGTHVLINGHEYVVEDRGVGGMWIDIYVSSHSEALQKGMYTTDVYIR